MPCNNSTTNITDIFKNQNNNPTSAAQNAAPKEVLIFPGTIEPTIHTTHQLSSKHTKQKKSLQRKKS
ncbi:hypothetical protein SESBI_23888 [Sesbania bispinosa]|nr:hypothetical protein SESBI_23888 [Sesbania bispinosa]